MTTPMIGHFIGGNPMASRSERTSEVFNPATGAVTTGGRLLPERDGRYQTGLAF